MTSVKLETGFNIDIEFALASLLKRSAAWIIDLIICWIYVAIAASLADTRSFFIWTNFWDLSGLLISLPVAVYHFCFEWLNQGRSIGKMLMGIKVITLEGGQPTVGQYLIRWVFRLLDFAFWIPVAVVEGVLPWWTLPITFAGLIAVIATPNNQRIGDLVAGTILIDLKRDTTWKDTVFEEIDSDYSPSFPEIMQLSDRDINTLKSITETIRKNNDRDLATRIAQRICDKLNIQTELDPYHFLVTLLKDYNFYTDEQSDQV